MRDYFHFRIVIVGLTTIIMAFAILSVSPSEIVIAVSTPGAQEGGRPTPTPTRKPRPTTAKKRPAKRTSSAKTKAQSDAPANNRAQQTSDEPKVDDAEATERTYWETIRLSTKAEDFKSYLEKYPNGHFAALARDNLGRLETAAKTPVKTDSAGRIILGSISDSGTGAAKPAPKPGLIVRNQIEMELVYVPAGSFMMGWPKGFVTDKPVHEVTIQAGFYIGRYEVTQAEWQQVMGNNPSGFKGDNLPVEVVSWDDAQSFIGKLNGQGEGFKYRLPSEAEWEYACRAGTTGDYAGDVNEMAWFSANSGLRTHAVGGKRPNAWGLADMHGNVWEWCADYYHESYNGAPTDGSAWLTGGETKYRVVRGGAWNVNHLGLRSSHRSKGWQDYRSNLVGFRVVAVVRTQ